MNTIVTNFYYFFIFKGTINFTLKENIGNVNTVLLLLQTFMDLLICEGISIIFGIGVATCTAVVVARCNDT
jgi:hypothetical protein